MGDKPDRRILIIFCLISFFIACNMQEPYRIGDPDKKLLLEKDLNEISGLHYLDKKTLLAVQDEKGRIYFVDPDNGKIRKSLKVTKDGDFEGVAASGDEFFILRSDGDVFRYDNTNGEVKRCSFDGGKGFDFEGLCINNDKDELWVACKTHGNKKENKYVWVYRIGLKEFKYKKKPAFRIDKKEIRTMHDFEPSGIEVHPDGSIYLISSTANSILILDSEFKIIKTGHLERSIFSQPEGITFDRKKSLYISNEKVNSKASILKFLEQ